MRKTTMKKALALILALVLCVGVLAACDTKPADETTKPAAQSTTAPAADGTTAPAAPTEYEFPAGAELDVYGAHDINGLPLDLFIEEATGLNITWVPEGGNLEVLQNRMTQKVTPSLIFYYGPDWGHEMGRYGAFVNLYDYKDILPDFFARYEAYGQEIKDLYETSPGELYTAPVFLNGDVQHYGWYYREDVFADLGLSVPTTWDEFLNVCAKLKEAYPNSYPLTMRNLTGNMGAFYELAQQFGVDYSNTGPSLDLETGKFYTSWTTDEARNMLKMWRELITLGYMDVAALSNGTAEWVADLSSGKSFITHDKAFQLTNLEKAGQEQNPDFSLSWWNNYPIVESDLPYQCRATRDYQYSWHVTTKCADVELALRYLNWMYSDEGSLVLSWGKEGESYTVDANGNKSFIEGYDATFQARYQESGYIDMKATAATYSPKCQEMIFDTMAAAAEGDFWAPPSLVFTSAEEKSNATYMTDYANTKNAYWQKYLLGELDINDDATWQKFKDELAAYNEAEILANYDAAYARFVAGE